MRKVLSAALITGSVITAICGILILIIEIDLMQTVDVDTVASFLIGVLLIGSPLFVMLLLKQRTAGSIMVLLSAVLFTLYLFRIQTNGLTVDPAVLTGVCIVQAAMCILTVVHWLTQNAH